MAKLKDPKPKAVRKLLKPYEIAEGRHFKLKDIDPDDDGGIDSRELAEHWLSFGIERLADLQDKLYARSTWSLLLIFQAMDAAGKDSTIKHVMSGVNPQGCQVYSFKKPSDEELRHDFLWRCARRLPERGRIGIFNRSYYEEVLVVRVHDDLLQRQSLPQEVITDDIWKERYEDIRGFERHLRRSGTQVLKFFLHVSKKEQRKRFLERLDKPEKNWKFSSRDLAERKLWRDYHAAYEDMIQHTATAHSPWYVVPADHKWFTRLIVAAAIVNALSKLDLKRPPLDPAERRALDAGRSELMRKDG
jgi:PPK2 family polyphosphate:nucleotide phosphotransferase